MTYTEADLIPLSALQHMVYCDRQAALIHLEQAWTENHLTAEGRVMHRRTDTPETEVRGDIRISRALKLRSLTLGLSGQADVVEFHRIENSLNSEGTGMLLPSVNGRWRPFPVEYKRGHRKNHNADRIQLCAQAICLEEMHQTVINEGALFYGETKRREDVAFTQSLRDEVASVAKKLHQMMQSGETPPATYHPKKCDNCSLLNQCLPPRSRTPQSASKWLRNTLINHLQDKGES